MGVGLRTDAPSAAGGRDFTLFSSTASVPYPTTHYSWTWDLASSPAALWPFITDTDRFNRDCGFPSVRAVPAAQIKGKVAPGTRRLRAHHLGMVIEWDERPFVWVTPHRFGVDRLFHRGPFARILAQCDLEPLGASGTRLTYQTWFTPANAVGALALRAGGAQWQFRWPFERVFRHYDQLVQEGRRESTLSPHPRLSPGGRARLLSIQENLRHQPGVSPELIDHLGVFVSESDDLEAQRMRAYALADRWRSDRRETLRVCLQATRAGLLDFRWDVICPHCRGAKAVVSHLAELPTKVHCETCRIDFATEFDRSVELTFTPNPAVRRVPRVEYCVGGPQITPHIVIQQTLFPGSDDTLVLDLPPARYRLRVPGVERLWSFTLAPDAEDRAVRRLDLSQLPAESDTVLKTGTALSVHNPADAPRQVIIEHLAWSDQATLASEVTSLQLFRDLFARELLRPGTQFSVGSLTVVFTDLKGSTQLYRAIGDAPAFSRVLTHFELVKAAIEAERGAIVKTMGDAVMAVFPRPAPAIRAMCAAQHHLALVQSASPWGTSLGVKAPPEPLTLKVGIHHGPCIVITQNDRLDYFGTTVNTAARLCNLSTGSDLVLSNAVASDLEAMTVLGNKEFKLRVRPEQTQLRGMEGDVFEVYRVRRG